MDATMRELVRRRAGNRWSIAVCARNIGSDDVDNLALACHRCNLHKGPNLTGIDPQTGQIASLFHPRRDPWSGNFLFEGTRIIGIGAARRATVAVLNRNDARRLELRAGIRKRSGLT